MQYVKGEDFGPPQKCGARHPKWSSVTCERYGECIDGHHMGIVGGLGNRHFTYWQGEQNAQTEETETQSTRLQILRRMSGVD